MKIVDDSELLKQPYDHDGEYVSKSALKRESTAAQDLGAQLLTLSKSQLDRITLDDSLLDALALAKKIKPNTDAHRRQVQYIGRLMRNIDIEPIKASLDKIMNRKNQVAAQVQLTEKLRDRLLAEGDAAVQELVEQYPSLDRQKLRQMLRQASKELTKVELSQSAAASNLFKYLLAETSA
ncbi:ribosome-associated protein [Shewanella avicenniae]|uniref:Dual-action ribosomal maturation protein DarP n=1 Tax=Shewanella avicenniae TaxID=2814294 RepID=A0ABX7QP18_9GAMM|nr:ribosome biogenesis factor YjgA [Shewanella avicenniae]QSX33222.1 ribosome-associated protein [Shewanella avicenniae]